jgi:ubiquinone/menaquinone biosynthesis C-methylase UbiE
MRRLVTIMDYSDYLKFLHSLEFFRRYKQRSFELLRLHDALSILDVGCGVGEDALAMATRVRPTGKVTGIDESRSFLEQARARLSGQDDNIEFVLGDALYLPFEEATFDRCRVDRTLLHLSDPAQALSGMVRVLRRGGWMLAFDADWETFTFSFRNREKARRVAHLLCDTWPSGWIGRYLYGYFKACGLIDIEVHPQTLVITELEVADKVFDLYWSINRAREIHLISSAEATELFEELRGCDEAGTFFCSYTGFMVVGQKP